MKGKGIILVNMGGAESQDEVKNFLKNMFMDKTILPLPLPLRMFLSWRITSKRYKKSWQRYQEVGGTDIKHSTESYAKQLSSLLGNKYLVETAYVYSKSSPLQKLQAMIAQEVSDITVISMFPHPSICTNGIIRKNIQTTQSKYTDISIRFIEDICKYDNFLKYWQTLIKNHIESNNLKSPLLLFSAHSIPQTFVDNGDKYPDYVLDSATKIADSLDLEFDVGYQSRFGKAKWLLPETQELLQVYKDEQEVVLVPISFVCENLETKFDLDVEFIRFAKKSLKMRNITRIKLPVNNEILLNTLKDAVLNND